MTQLAASNISFGDAARQETPLQSDSTLVSPPHEGPVAHQVRNLRVLLAHLLLAVSPAVILTISFAIAVVRLSGNVGSGVSLTSFYVAAAVVVPLLSQGISAAVFGALGPLNSNQPGAVSRVVLRFLPCVLIPGVLLSIIAASVLGVMQQWPVLVSAQLALSLFLQLALAALLTIAFASRRYIRLPIAWLVFGLGIALLPRLWWFSSLLAVVTQLAFAFRDIKNRDQDGVLAVRAASLPLPAVRDTILRAAGGLSDGVPLWGLPLVLWIIMGGQVDATTTFLAILPAIVGVQVFFVLHVEPLWDSLAQLNVKLSSQPYREASLSARKFGNRALTGVGIILGFIVLLDILGAFALMHLGYSDTHMFAGQMMLASGAAAVVFMLSHLYSMLHNRSWVHGTALVLVAVHLGSLLLGIGVGQWLITVTVAGVLLAAAFLIATWRAWQRPEHRIFWVGALAS